MVFLRGSLGQKRKDGWRRACRRRIGHEEGLGGCQPPLHSRDREALGWSEANEESEVVGHDRGPDVSLEVVEPAPGATGQAVGPLEAGDAGLDAGAEVAQFAIDPVAADHVFDREAALLVKGHVADAARLRPAQIIATGKAAIRRCLTGRRAVSGDVALQHGQEPVAVGPVTRFYLQVEDQAALAGGQGELVTVINVAAALDDDVGMGLEQADQLVAGGPPLAADPPPLALRDHPLDQWLIVTDLGLPEDDRWAARPGQPR